MPNRVENTLAWKLRARQGSFRALVGQTAKLIEQALDTATFSISWSGGKDSTALTHLVLSIDPSVPVVIQFDDCDWPEKESYVDRVTESQGWIIHKVRPDFSVWDAVSGLRLQDEYICSQSHWITKEAFLKPLNQKRRELGCNGVFLGLRTEESDARKRNHKSRGPIYQLTDGSWRSNPLWQWRAEDVFAYLISNGVEINPCYFHNRYLPPEAIRLSWALPTPVGLAVGTMEHIRHYYPQQFRRLRNQGIE